MKTKASAVRHQPSAAEIDVHYWEAELLAAVARHDAAIDALFLAADEVHELKAQTAAARQRLRESRRQPTSITVHPNWRTDESA
jgi:hypothetical protein